jgi:hypothetical protein
LILFRCVNFRKDTQYFWGIFRWKLIDLSDYPLSKFLTKFKAFEPSFKKNIGKIRPRPPQKVPSSPILFFIRLIFLLFFFFARLKRSIVQKHLSKQNVEKFYILCDFQSVLLRDYITKIIFYFFLSYCNDTKFLFYFYCIRKSVEKWIKINENFCDFDRAELALLTFGSFRDHKIDFTLYL